MTRVKHKYPLPVSAVIQSQRLRIQTEKTTGKRLIHFPDSSHLLSWLEKQERYSQTHTRLWFNLRLKQLINDQKGNAKIHGKSCALKLSPPFQLNCLLSFCRELLLCLDSVSRQKVSLQKEKQEKEPSLPFVTKSKKKQWHTWLTPERQLYCWTVHHHVLWSLRRRDVQQRVMFDERKRVCEGRTSRQSWRRTQNSMSYILCRILFLSSLLSQFIFYWTMIFSGITVGNCLSSVLWDMPWESGLITRRSKSI